MEILNLHFQIEILKIFFEKFYLVEYFSKQTRLFGAPRTYNLIDW